jgi:nucleoside-diphosphate-sugar epimerase
MTTVLITGAAGYVASYILPLFRERFDLRLVDNRDVDGLGRPVDGLQVRDISDLNRMDEYRDLFRGVDAVVHLAHLRPSSDSLHDRYLAERGDVDMAYIVYQLSLEEGVRRVVMASSNHATDFYERPLRSKQLDMVYPEGSAQRPLADNFYGWPMRSTCRMFSDGAIWSAAPSRYQPTGDQSMRASYLPRPIRTGSTRSISTPSA